MKEMKRAKRRYHRQRVQQARRLYWAEYGNRLSCDRVALRRFLGIISRSPCVCSCWMCGRPRKVFGRPFSELRLLQDGLQE